MHHIRFHRSDVVSRFRPGRQDVAAAATNLLRRAEKSKTFLFSSRSHTLIDAQLPFSITRLFCLERQIIRNDMDFKFNLLKC